VVKSFGGEVRIVGDPKNHSTRELLTEISRRAQGFSHHFASRPSVLIRWKE
jgi:hypothetical protein